MVNCIYLTLFSSRTSLSDYSSEKGEFDFVCSVVLQDLMGNIKGSPELLRFPASSIVFCFVYISFSILNLKFILYFSVLFVVFQRGPFRNKKIE